MCRIWYQKSQTRLEAGRDLVQRNIHLGLGIPDPLTPLQQNIDIPATEKNEAVFVAK